MKPKCITAEMKKDRIRNEYDYHKYWKDMYEKEKKKRQEAEGEMTIVKGIGMNSPEMKTAKAKIEELHNSLERFKLENNNLYTRVAASLEVNEYHQDLNGKLRKEVDELEADLARAKEDHQFDNLVHQKELENMRKK